VRRTDIRGEYNETNSEAAELLPSGERKRALSKKGGQSNRNFASIFKKDGKFHVGMRGVRRFQAGRTKPVRGAGYGGEGGR